MIGNLPAESEWGRLRLGKITSSQIQALFTQPKTVAARQAAELSETAKTYILEKISEMLTGTFRELSTHATEWGDLYEPEAIEELKKMFPEYAEMEHFGNHNRKFFPYTDCSGGSPDSVLKSLYTVGEVKCPENPVNHIKNLLLKTSADLKEEHADHWHQLQMNMCCVAKYYDLPIFKMRGLYVSYDPRMNKEDLKLKVLHVPIDMEFANQLPKVIEAGEIFMLQTIKQLLSA